MQNCCIRAFQKPLFCGIVRGGEILKNERKEFMKKFIAILVVIIIAYIAYQRYSGSGLSLEKLPENKNYTPVSSNYSYDALPDAGSRSVYERLETLAYSSVQEKEEYYILGTISGKEKDIDYTQFYLGYRAFLDDHPEVFWLTHGADNAFDPSEYIVLSSYPSDELKTMKKEFRSSLENFLDNVPQGLEQEELERYIHDYIIDNCEYDLDALDENGKADLEYPNYGKTHSAYGVFVDKKAVCSGYAQAYQLLLNRLGIDCVPIYGQATSLDDYEFKVRQYGTDHQWNAVKDSSGWSMSDLTWDDVEDQERRYEYFHIPIDEMYEDHNALKLDFNTYKASLILNLNTDGDCLFLPE